MRGEQNHTHASFKCPTLERLWEDVDKTLNYVFDLKERLKPESMLCVNPLGTIKLTDINVFSVLCMTAIKQWHHELMDINNKTHFRHGKVNFHSQRQNKKRWTTKKDSTNWTFHNLWKKSILKKCSGLCKCFYFMEDNKERLICITRCQSTRHVFAGGEG